MYIDYTAYSHVYLLIIFIRVGLRKSISGIRPKFVSGIRVAPNLGVMNWLHDTVSLKPTLQFYDDASLSSAEIRNVGLVKSPQA